MKCTSPGLQGLTHAGLTAVVVSAALASAMVAGCATTERAAQLVVDHHIGMARAAIDVLSGEAEARQQRIGHLQAEMKAGGDAIATEQDPTRLIELLKRQVAWQGALIAELQHAGGHSGHQLVAAEPDGEHSGHHPQE